MKTKLMNGFFKTIGSHGFARACHEDGAFFTELETFMNGFLTGQGGGVKKSKAKVRVTGLNKNPGAVYGRADWIIKALNSRTYAGAKNVKV